MRFISVATLWLMLSLCLGCCSDDTGSNGNGDGGDQQDGQDQLDGTVNDAGDAGDAGETGDADGAAGGDDGGMVDAGGDEVGPDGGADAGGGDQEGDPGGADIEDRCKSVDLVIVVDASGSMRDELRAMRETVFPAFAARMIEIGHGLEDFRVGTADSCPDPANFHTRGAGGECNFFGGNVWIESTSPTMTAEFACVGDIYTDDVNCSGNNDDEQPASAAATCLEPPWSTGTNAGFLREDALLVIIAITDEDETPTGQAQTAQEIFDRLVAIKGDVERIVFLGIGGSRDCVGEYGTADEAVLLMAITDLFIQHERGVWWDLCEGRLEDGLEEAIAVIESACYF